MALSETSVPRKHQNWIAQPAQFSLNGLRYTPDFYDGERNVFIEVSNTRQAYSANKHKYELLRKLFPKLGFEVRKPSGELLNKDEAINPQLLQQYIMKEISNARENNTHSLRR